MVGWIWTDELRHFDFFWIYWLVTRWCGKPWFPKSNTEIITCFWKKYKLLRKYKIYISVGYWFLIDRLLSCGNCCLFWTHLQHRHGRRLTPTPSLKTTNLSTVTPAAGKLALVFYISTKRLHWTAWKHSSLTHSLTQSICWSIMTIRPSHLTKIQKTNRTQPRVKKLEGAPRLNVSCDAVSPWRYRIRTLSSLSLSPSLSACCCHCQCRIAWNRWDPEAAASATTPAALHRASELGVEVRLELRA